MADSGILDRVVDYQRYFETLNPDSVTALRSMVVDDFHFRDPFHEVKDVNAAVNLFAGMLNSLANAEFLFFEPFIGDHSAVLRWRFRYQFEGKHNTHEFDGMTYLVFNDAGKITRHIDYWDAASGLYEHVPLFGRLVRLARRHIARRAQGTW